MICELPDSGRKIRQIQGDSQRENICQSESEKEVEGHQ